MATSTTGVGGSTRCAQSLLTDSEEAAWLGLQCTHARVLSALDRELERAQRLSATAYGCCSRWHEPGRPGFA
jgi:hypothetical protein